jgi:hypothetical protein
MPFGDQSTCFALDFGCHKIVQTPLSTLCIYPKVHLRLTGNLLPPQRIGGDNMELATDYKIAGHARMTRAESDVSELK